MTSPPSTADTDVDGTDVPPRFDCLCCDRDYFTEAELTEHVTGDHSPDDVAISMAPLNIPSVARFPNDPEITTREEALKAIKRDGRDGEVPDVTRQLSNGVCPICGEEAATTADVPVRMVPPHGHDTWEWYQALRDAVPDEYEQSPEFDDAGYPDPAGTVMELVPSDRIQFTVEGWDEPARGYVREIDDPRTEVTAAGWMKREVAITAANTPGGADRVAATLHPDSDGTVRLQQRGRASAAAVSEPVLSIDRQPWHEQPEP